MTPTGPEARAREKIDAQLEAAGWAVQSRDQLNLDAARGVAAREIRMEAGFGVADYLLFLDRKAVGAFEAKKAGVALSGIELQAKKYSDGLPRTLRAPHRPLPFLYLGTGEETGFVNRFDPVPRTRRVFSVHSPETLAEWLMAPTLAGWIASQPAGTVDEPGLDNTKPSTLRSRLRFTLPPIDPHGLWPNQREAMQKLEDSLRADRPRALIQMATGSGKSKFAVAEMYRLIKFAGARRVLFLVDRDNLGEQAEKEFLGYRTPDDNRKFTDLYGVQRLQSNTILDSTKVVISTIQRLYSMLRGDPADLELPEGAEHGSHVLLPGLRPNEAVPVVYNPAVPPEFFDIVVVDECHRSIYTTWRQVLEYFDAHLIGLTATPAKQTFGFFNKNLVMEYPHERAVADGVNVDFEIYTIRTRITESGSTIERSELKGVRDRRTHQIRWETADEDITYSAEELDHKVMSKDQIRTVIRAFKDALFTEIFVGRKEVPKTLVFAKDDLHAEDIVAVVREEFAEGNEFCQKITYKTTAKKPKDLIQEFRIGYWPRIAVTVDMIATGTDIRPVEIVVFMRAVQSRVLFEQMKGRGVRVIDPTELRAVSPSAGAKTHFVVVDCVGVTETQLVDTQPLERHPGVSLKELFDHVALGGTDPDLLSSLASRLARLQVQCDEADEAQIEAASGGVGLSKLCGEILAGLDPDAQAQQARTTFDLKPGERPSDAQLDQAQEQLLRAAVAPLAQRPALRTLLLDLKRKFEQIIDDVSVDQVHFAGSSADARERARALTQSFEAFLEKNRDEIDALQFFYSQPYGQRPRFRDIKALAETIQSPPRSWTTPAPGPPPLSGAPTSCSRRTRSEAPPRPESSPT